MTIAPFHEWVAGDAISLADLLLAAHLSMFAQESEGVQISTRESEGFGSHARKRARAWQQPPGTGSSSGCRLPSEAEGRAMLIRSLAPLIVVLPFAGPASAEVKSVTPNGFEVATAATIRASPDRVYAALGEVGHWWDPSHTFSRDAANLSMELPAGG